MALNEHCNFLSCYYFCVGTLMDVTLVGNALLRVPYYSQYDVIRRETVGFFMCVLVVDCFAPGGPVYVLLYARKSFVTSRGVFFFFSIYFWLRFCRYCIKGARKNRV